MNVRNIIRLAPLTAVLVGLVSARAAEPAAGKAADLKGEVRSKDTVRVQTKTEDGDIRNANAGRASQVELTRFEVPQRLKEQLPSNVQGQLDRYRTLSETYNAQQRELSRQLRGSTEQQREAIREQLRVSREQFLEDTRQLRADIREQLNALRTTLRDLQKPVDSGVGSPGGRPRGN
jgi:hypothetical protein